MMPKVPLGAVLCYNEAMASRTSVIIAFNTGAQFIGRVLSSGTTFLTSILLARALGIEGYGDFSKITTFVAFFYLSVDFGLNAAYLQIKKEDSRLRFGHLMGIRILLGLGNIFLALAILSFLPGSGDQGYTSLVRLGIIIYSLTIFLQSLITTANAELQERLQYHIATIGIGVSSLFILALLFVGAGRTVLSAIIIFTIGTLLLLSTELAFIRKLGTHLSPIFDLSTYLPLLKTALPLSMTLVFNIIYFRIDSVILTITRSTSDVGLYNLAYKFFEFPLTLPVFFLNALYPIFLENKDSNFPKFTGHVKKSALLLLSVSFPVLIAVYIGASYIPLIKPEFEPSVVILRILSLGIPFFFLSNLTMWILITLKRHRSLVAIYGGSMIFVTFLNVWFTPAYGPTAAAWITVVGEGIVVGISSFVVLRIFRARQEHPLKRIIAS